MANEYILLNMDDEKSGKMAEVMANKTCKKILSALAEEELSETDISRKINLPLNTIEYNLNKLISSGLVEKAKTHFWSVKGKKIPVYKLANKYIVIAPKTSSKVLKNFLPVALVSLIGALIIRFFTLNGFNQRLTESAGKSAEIVPLLSAGESANFAGLRLWDKIIAIPGWEWFLIGAWFAVVLFLILTIVRRKN